MAKFNKDTFLKDITDKVQTAIDKNLITKEDVANNDLERLHGFIQYELLEYIEDRKFAIDVLKDFNYDEKAPWANLQNEYGTFKSLMDIALVNLWKFIQSEGFDQYSGYSHDNSQEGKPMLDIVHALEDIPGDGEPSATAPVNSASEKDAPEMELGFNAVKPNSENDFEDNGPAEEPENEFPAEEPRRFAPRRTFHVK